MRHSVMQVVRRLEVDITGSSKSAGAAEALRAAHTFFFSDEKP